MSMIPYVLLGIGIDVVIFASIYMCTRNRSKMSYSDYLRDYGSVADSQNYSNHNDY